MNKSVMDIQKMIANEVGSRITIDGIMGPETRGAINRLNLPDWMKIGLNELGVKEIHGNKHNPRVVFYHSFTGKYSTDEIPWCGSFIAMCMRISGIEPPKLAERALNWLSFGKSSDGPQIGAVAVKGRRGGGHVGIVISIDGDYLYLLGGNQGDEVNIRKYRTDAFIDFRIPREYHMEDTVHYAFNSKLSQIKEA